MKKQRLLKDRARGTRPTSKVERVKHHVTIRDVAKAAKASVSTVSAALNDSDYVSAGMRSRIEGAIKALRYRPNDLARGLRLQRTHSIAIVVPDLANNFYIELVRGAKDYSASANYTVLIGDSRDSWDQERNYLDSFHRRRVDGVIRVPAINAAGGKTKSILGNLPVVYADRYPQARDSYVGRVGVDNAQAAESATRYLLSLGHRHIGVITGDPSSGTSVDRLKGFAHALRGAKIRPDASMIHTGHNDMESGKYARLILERSGVPFPAERIWGKERARPKTELLRVLHREHGVDYGDIWFVEDRLKTLHSVEQQADLGEVGLFLATWGYNTPAEQDAAGAHQRIIPLTLEQFCGAFSAWKQ